MKAAIYARTASTETTTEHQIALCCEYVTHEGGTVERIYVDEGVGGNTMERAGFASLLRDAKSNLFDTVVVTDAARVTRNAAKFQEFMNGLGQLGISFVAVKAP